MKMRDAVDQENPPNIDISFASGAHGCAEALDGPGGIGISLNLNHSILTNTFLVAHSAYLPHGLIHLSFCLIDTFQIKRF